MGLFGTAKDAVKGYDKCKTTEKLTYDQLFDIIKDIEFPCGVPVLEGKGIMRCIKFPEQDKYRIQIAITGKSVQATKTYAGAGGFAKEMAGDALTKGWFSAANSENISTNRMTVTVIDIVSEALKAKGLLAKR